MNLHFLIRLVTVPSDFFVTISFSSLPFALLLVGCASFMGSLSEYPLEVICCSKTLSRCTASWLEFLTSTSLSELLLLLLLEGGGLGVFWMDKALDTTQVFRGSFLLTKLIHCSNGYGVLILYLNSCGRFMVFQN